MVYQRDYEDQVVKEVNMDISDYAMLQSALNLYYPAAPYRLNMLMKTAIPTRLCIQPFDSQRIYANNVILETG